LSEHRYKVLVLASTFPRWTGDHQPAFVFELCRRLAAARDVTVLAPGAPGAAGEEVIEGIRVRRYRYAPAALQSLAYGGGLLANLRSEPWRALLVPGFLAAQWRALVRVLRSESWDVLHAHWTLPQGIVGASAMAFHRGRKPRLIITAHGSDVLRLRGWFWDALNRHALSAADAVTVVGPELEDRVLGLGVPREHLCHLPMGVDVANRFLPGTPHESPGARILFVGRLVPEKGADLAIRALPAVLESYPDAQLEIVGDGPERGRLENSAKLLNVSARVSFVGALPADALPPKYRAATLCVVPSRSEGFGLVAIEAMACGCPVVVSDLPSLKKTAMDGDAAVVVPSENAMALAVAIVRLLDDRPRMALLATRGRIRAESYAWNATANGYAELIDRLAGEHSERTDG
jgi:glycosyltransferase involved in cell wall biosynthesis